MATNTPDEITKIFVGHPLVESVIAQGPTKSSVRLRSGIQCDLRVVAPAEYPFALNYFTGSKEHNIVMRNRALQARLDTERIPTRPGSGRTESRKKKAERKNSGGSRRG